MKHIKACNEAKLISDPPPGSPLLAGRVEELSRAVGNPSGHWDSGNTVVAAGMVRGWHSSRAEHTQKLFTLS